jgi:hypothetical protein
MALQAVARPKRRASFHRYGIPDGNTCPTLWFSSMITRILVTVARGADPVPGVTVARVTVARVTVARVTVARVTVAVAAAVGTAVAAGPVLAGVPSVAWPLVTEPQPAASKQPRAAAATGPRRYAPKPAAGLPRNARKPAAGLPRNARTPAAALRGSICMTSSYQCAHLLRYLPVRLTVSGSEGGWPTGDGLARRQGLRI